MALLGRFVQRGAADFVLAVCRGAALEQELDDFEMAFLGREVQAQENFSWRQGEIQRSRL